jgi:hypothetical protein
MHPAGHPVDVAAARVGNAGGTQAYGQGTASRNGLQFMDKITDAMGEQRLRAAPFAIARGQGAGLHKGAGFTFQKGCFDVGATEIDADREP